MAGALADKDITLAGDEIQVGYNLVYSNSSIHAYYIVKQLPKFIPATLYRSLRQAVADLHLDPQVFVHFNTRGVAHAINWNSRDMRMRKHQWELYERDRRNRKGNVFKESSELTTSAVDNWRIESWNFFQMAQTTKDILFNCESIIELSTTGNSHLHKESIELAAEQVEHWCAYNDICIKRVKGNLASFLKYTSITSLDPTSYAAQSVPNRILSSKLMGELLTYTPGRINDTGVPMGVDAGTGMVVYKSLVRPNGEAENFAVLAETGSGKSFFIKNLMLMISLNNFHQLILDVDGEYQKLTEAMDGVIINMGKGTGVYFDSTVIGELTGNDEIDAALCWESINTTMTVFCYLCDIKTGMTAEEEKLFNLAYRKMFKAFGISEEDKNTWSNSSKLNYHVLYNYIKSLGEDKEVAAQHKKAFEQLCAKLYVFFEPHGIRSYMFKQPITLEEIFKRKSKTPLILDIVLNLDSSEESESRVGIEDFLKQMTAMYLVTLCTNYYKSKGQFSVHYIEEFQRYGASQSAGSLVKYMVSGNRKRNACTFVISNSPTNLFATSTGEIVKDNVNNFIIGKLKDKTIDVVCSQFNLDYCKDILQRISGIKGNGNKYKHTFLIQINDADTTIIRQTLPAHISSGPIFATRTTTHDNNLIHDNNSDDIGINNEDCVDVIIDGNDGDDIVGYIEESLLNKEPGRPDMEKYQNNLNNNGDLI